MTVTFAELKARARSRADMDGSEFVTDEEFALYVRDSAAELYDVLVSSFQDYYLETTAEATLSLGEASIALPSSFYKLRGVDRYSSSAQWTTLSPYSFAERNDNSGSMTSSGIRYRVQAGALKLTPTDACDGTYRVHYVPLMPALTLDADVFDDHNRWADYIVVDAAIKALQKEESSTTTLEKQKQALLKRIEDMSKQVDAGGPEVVVDSSRRLDWWSL